MAHVTYDLPVLGESAATEDPKVRTALDQLKTQVNGGLDASNLANGAVTQEKMAAGLGFRVVGGLVQPPTTIINGSGFTVARVAEGEFRVTFTTAFATPPNVVVCLAAAQGYASLASYTVPPSTSQVTFFTRPHGVVDDASFSFLAIGT